MPGSVLESWTSLMFKRQQTRPRGPLVHADAPVRAQRPGENRIVTAAATAVGRRLFIASSLAPWLEVGLHFDGKAQEVSMGSTVFRRTGYQVVRIAGLVGPGNYRSLNWSFEFHSRPPVDPTGSKSPRPTPSGWALPHSARISHSAN